MLRRLYPEPDDLGPARRRLTLFLGQYWGGPATYSEERGHPRLRMRHFPFAIGPAERDRWLLHMARGREQTAPTPAIAERLMTYFGRPPRRCATATTDQARSSSASRSSWNSLDTAGRPPATSRRPRRRRPSRTGSPSPRRRRPGRDGRRCPGRRRRGRTGSASGPAPSRGGSLVDERAQPGRAARGCPATAPRSPPRRLDPARGWCAPAASTSPCRVAVTSRMKRVAAAECVHVAVAAGAVGRVARRSASSRSTASTPSRPSSARGTPTCSSAPVSDISPSAPPRAFIPTSGSVPTDAGRDDRDLVVGVRALDDHGHAAVVAGVPLLVVGEERGVRAARTTKSVQRSIGAGGGAGSMRTPSGGGHEPSSTAYSSSNALTAKTSMNRSPAPSAMPSSCATSRGTASPRGREVRRQQRLEVAVGQAVAAGVAEGEVDRAGMPVGQRPADDPAARGQGRRRRR